MTKKLLLLLLLLIIFIRVYSQKNQPKTVLLFLYENVEILDFAGPMEVFIQAGMQVYTVAPTRQLKSMNRLQITVDYTIDDISIPRPDVLIVPGGDGAHVCLEDKKIVDWIANQSKHSIIDLSVCTGAYLFAEAGMLDHKKTTTFYSLLDNFQNVYPKLKVLKGVRFVDNGEIISTAGISAGIDGSLHLVSRIFGKDWANQIAQNMEYDKPDINAGYIETNDFIKNFNNNPIMTLESTEKYTMLKGDFLNLGDKMMDENQLDKAILLYQFVINNYQKYASDYAKLGKAMKTLEMDAPINEKDLLVILKNEPIEKVIKLYTSDKKKFPDWILFRNWVIMMEADQIAENGDYYKAIDYMKFMKSATPDFANAYMQSASYFEKIGNRESALADYKKALELNPGLRVANQKIEELSKKS